jgi:hypothetical protein
MRREGERRERRDIGEEKGEWRVARERRGGVRREEGCPRPRGPPNGRHTPLNVGCQGLRQLVAADVGNGRQRQALQGILGRLKVVADGLHDEGDLLVGVVQEDGGGEVTHRLLRVRTRRHQVDGLHINGERGRGGGGGDLQHTGRVHLHTHLGAGATQVCTAGATSASNSPRCDQSPPRTLDGKHGQEEVAGEGEGEVVRQDSDGNEAQHTTPTHAADVPSRYMYTSFHTYFFLS